MAYSFPTISFIEQRADSFSEVGYQLVNQILKDAQKKDVLTKRRATAALKEIQKHFSSEATSFSFSSIVRASLSKEREILENLTELAALLGGTSTSFPLGGKCDGAGEKYELLSSEEEEGITKRLWEKVAKKIETSVAELRQDMHTSKPFVSVQRDPSERRAFEERAAQVKQHLEMRSSREGALSLVSQDGLELEHLDDVLKNDPEIILRAVTQNGLALQFAHERLRNAIQIVVAALRCPHSNPDRVAPYIGDDLKKSPELLQAIAVDEMVIGYGDTELVEDLNFLMDAVSKNPFVLQLLHENLRNHKELVIEGLRPLCYEEDTTRARRYIQEIVGNEIRPFAEAFFKIISSKGLFYGSPRMPEPLKEDQSLIAEWIKVTLQLNMLTRSELIATIKRSVPLSQQPFAEAFCRVCAYPGTLPQDTAFLENRLLCLQLVKGNGNLLFSLPLHMQQEPHLLNCAIASSPEILSQLPEPVFLEYIRKERGLFIYAPRETALRLVKTDPEILSSMDRRVLKEQRKILVNFVILMFSALAGNKTRFLSLSSRMQQEIGTFCNAIFKVLQNPDNLSTLPPELQNDPYIASVAKRRYGQKFI